MVRRFIKCCVFACLTKAVSSSYMSWLTGAACTAHGYEYSGTNWSCIPGRTCTCMATWPLRESRALTDDRRREYVVSMNPLTRKYGLPTRLPTRTSGRQLRQRRGRREIVWNARRRRNSVKSQVHTSRNCRALIAARQCQPDAELSPIIHRRPRKITGISPPPPSKRDSATSLSSWSATR